MLMMHGLAKSQKLIYDMEKYAGGSISVICGSLLIEGSRDQAKLTAAVNELYRINAALRTRITEADGQPQQSTLDYAERDIGVLRFESKADLDRYAETCAKAPVDLYGDLCEISAILLPDRYGFLIKLHHIIGDAWALSLICSQFIALLNGETPQAFPYTEHLENELDYLRSDRYAKDRSFFLEQFKKCDEVTYLSEKQSDSFTSKRKTFVVDSDRTARIADYANQHNVSPFVLFMTAVATYISRIKQNVEKFYIGTAVLNRSGLREKNMVGMFVDTAPVLIELDNEKTFSENLSAVKDSSFSVLRHQKFNYGDVLSAIRQEHDFTERLYDVMLSYQNAAIAGAKAESTWYHSGAQAETLQIHIDDRDSEGIFRIHFDYQTDKLTEHEIERMYGHVINLLFDAIRNDSKPLYELEILSAGENQMLLYNFNDTAVDYPRDKCVHQLFEVQVKKTPEKTAVIACDRTLTYRELNEQANRIANSLIEHGVKPGDIVAFMLPRRSYLIAAMFGILKAGAAYLPIDPDYPKDRINYILEDSKATYLITEEKIAGLLENADSRNPCVAISSNSLSYCIYTSGTTGAPKGVLITHRNICNFIQKNSINAFQKTLADTCDTVICCNSLSFDITLQEVILPLLNGLTLFLIFNAQIYNLQASSELVSDDRLGLIITPTKLELYMMNEHFCSQILHRVSVLMCGAEPFPAKSLNQIRKYTNAIVFNGYGPTETTCGVLYSPITDIDNIAIGKPIANTQIYIVDRYMRPVPIGATGELCIAGDSIGVGYLNHPELTAEKFIDNPFGKGKLYKTSDLAYWREDGNIVYVGRNDFQVKIRGLRIELGEIENALQGVPGVAQAMVAVRRSAEGRQLICAFYTGRETDGKVFRSAIGQKLPKYMLPHIFTHLDELPLTTSGKVNRKALPEVDLSQIAVAAEYIEPIGEMEKQLVTLMEQVLSYSPIGRNDDFFDLGGDSLKAIEFVSKAHSEGIYFVLQSIFDHPTVQQLTEYIQTNDKQTVLYSETDFTEINKILEKNKLEYISTPQKIEVGNVLLAGATGYLGIHILADFIEHENGIAFCLVRGKDQADSEQRLINLLNFYFGGRYSECDRIRVLCGDLQKVYLGLPEREYETIIPKISTVINAAASVKHYGSYQYFYEVNVETVNRLIDFCRIAEARLIHISTLSVSGNSFGDEFNGYIGETEKHFFESSLYIGQSLDNVYARSKFEAEKVILEAMGKGLKANILRMGNLSNRLCDGIFQKNYESNAFLKRIKAFLELGMFPDYIMDMYTEFTPIDEAARAVMIIVQHFSTEQTVFHINNTKVVSFYKLQN